MGEGHDRRNCPALRATQAINLAIPAVENRNGVDGGPSSLPIGATMQEISPNINWDQVCYVFFDLETTGGSRTSDNIIELAPKVLGPDGIAIEDGSFDCLIHGIVQSHGFGFGRRQGEGLGRTNIEECDPTNEEVHDILGHYWQRGKVILSGLPEEMFQKFSERFTSPRSPGECRTGLQVSAGMANSPVKAWRLIFTTYILKRIVNHTYKPGQKVTSDDGDYDPSYKNLELEKRWAALFVPHQEHRVDETLLRALEERSLKSADISKAARYGIKLYV
ncbi:hypothetical protein IV203_011934 [Nitzschia inconspicua]|uniref:Exonuclease domain-containing protein n=1 Tax=Nitzschia inconspicua TaxID=303405 RepID=A0A9K3KT93_9STRA|nr:hypothetical protein IV203_011934 [Nitzschia inconspicua]